MLIKEFRIVLPISVDEYQVGQLYAVAEASKNETGGGEGVEVLTNKAYEEEDGEKGQYTHKVYHLESKVPSLVRAFAPKGSLSIHEKAWNAYPYCRTILTSEYKKDFQIKIETWHKNDMGTEDNVHKLRKELWEQTQIVNINIADNEVINSKEYKEELDPAKFKSVKTGRGPLGPDWQKELAKDSGCPHMCAYKLVTVEAKLRPFTGRLENLIQNMEQRIFTHFNRQLFCWIDKWADLSMEDIRRMEEETKKELDDMRSQGQVKGMGNDEA